MIEIVKTPHGPVELWTRLYGVVWTRPTVGTLWKPNPYSEKRYLVDALKSGTYRG